MPCCLVTGCGFKPESFAYQRANYEPFSVFRLPRSEPRRTKWLEFCKRHSQELPARPFICAQHFEAKWIRDHGKRKGLDPKAVPSLRPPKLDTKALHLKQGSMTGSDQDAPSSAVGGEAAASSSGISGATADSFSRTSANNGDGSTAVNMPSSSYTGSRSGSAHSLSIETNNSLDLQEGPLDVKENDEHGTLVKVVIVPEEFLAPEDMLCQQVDNERAAEKHNETESPGIAYECVSAAASELNEHVPVGEEGKGVAAQKDVQVMAKKKERSESIHVSAFQVLDSFRQAATSPWTYLESDKSLHFFRNELLEFSSLPACKQMLSIDRNTLEMTYLQCGDPVDMTMLAPSVFDQGQFVPTLKNVQLLISILKGRSNLHMGQKEVIKNVCHYMDSLISKNDEERDVSLLRFMKEQLMLYCKEVTSYSPAIVRLCLLIKFHSSAAYNALRDSEFLKLPCKTILYSYMVPKVGLGISTERKKELLSVAEKMTRTRRKAAIIFDEMYIQTSLSFDASGQMLGYAVNHPEAATLANTILTFMVQGLCTHFHRIVAFYPVNNPSAEFILQCFLDCVKGLEEVGFDVVLSVSDNHSTNRKLYRLLSQGSDQKIQENPAVPHPLRPGSRIVLMHDPVHVFKSIRNNFFRQTSWDIGNGKAVSWEVLFKLFDHERKMSVKKAHNLNLQVLQPNNFERLRVKLAVNVFSWNVRNALLYYHATDPDVFTASEVQPTVKFLDMGRKFFEALNIDHVKKGPIRSMESKKVTDLKEALSYFKKTAIPAGILTRETSQSLVETINGAIILIELLLQSGVQSVFTSRFLQDSLEEYFGAQRLRSGCAYKVNVTQFAQTDRKLTNVAVVTNSISSNTFRNKRKSIDWNDSPLEKSKPVSTVNCYESTSSVSDHDYTEKTPILVICDTVGIRTPLSVLDDSTQSTLLYIDGAVSRKMFNGMSCRNCLSHLCQLVKHEKSDSMHLNLMDFTGSSLLEPTASFLIVFHCLLTAFQMARKHIASASLNGNVLHDLMILGCCFLKEKGALTWLCEAHSKQVIQKLVRTTMKTLLKGYMDDVNKNKPRSDMNVPKPVKDRKLLTLTE